jgi:hypothetical protein
MLYHYSIGNSLTLVKIENVMKRLIITMSLSIIAYYAVDAGPTITFFVREYPTISISGPQKTVAFTPDMESVFVAYAGYLTVSAHLTGMVQFPRKTIKPKFYILVTDRIDPILLAHNTVHHWELEPGVPVALYSVEKKYDTDSKTYYWLTKAENSPKNNLISLETIIIFAYPDHVVIPEGITITDPDTPNLILPDVYIKPGIDEEEWAVLNLKNFLSPINLQYKKSEATNAIQILEK